MSNNILLNEKRIKEVAHILKENGVTKQAYKLNGDYYDLIDSNENFKGFSSKEVDLALTYFFNEGE